MWWICCLKCEWNTKLLVICASCKTNDMQIVFSEHIAVSNVKENRCKWSYIFESLLVLNYKIAKVGYLKKVSYFVSLS